MFPLYSCCIMIKNFPGSCSNSRNKTCLHWCKGLNLPASKTYYDDFEFLYLPSGMLRSFTCSKCMISTISYIFRVFGNLISDWIIVINSAPSLWSQIFQNPQSHTLHLKDTGKNRKKSNRFRCTFSCCYVTKYRCFWVFCRRSWIHDLQRTNILLKLTVRKHLPHVPQLYTVQLKGHYKCKRKPWSRTGGMKHEGLLK